MKTRFASSYHVQRYGGNQACHHHLLLFDAFSVVVSMFIHMNESKTMFNVETQPLDLFDAELLVLQSWM